MNQMERGDDGGQKKKVVLLGDYADDEECCACCGCQWAGSMLCPCKGKGDEHDHEDDEHRTSFCRKLKQSTKKMNSTYVCLIVFAIVLIGK
jgi:hypothetical protein